MTYTNKKAIHIRASKDLDEVLRHIANMRGLSKKQASDLVAMQMKKMIKNKKLEDLDEFKFW
jgi:hypothetical protein